MDSPFQAVRNTCLQTIFFLILTLIFCGCSKHTNIANNEYYEIKINDKTIKVEVASTQKKRMLGLMFRDKLDKDHGMLFIYPEKQTLSFWMKNTKIPLSIAFIKSNGEITQIESMSPYTLTSHVSKDEVNYALEMEEGWFRTNGFEVGSKVNFSSVINEVEVK